jgi:tRNA pseudouridine55 synthase
VILSPVPVRVTRAELLELTGASCRIAVTCSAGFYVRSFAHALGGIVGTGACLESLRRTRSGEFTIGQAVELESVQRASAVVAERWVPLERLLPGFPAVRLDSEGRKRVTHGQMVERAYALCGEDTSVRQPGTWVRLLDEEGQLVALATVVQTGESLHPAIVLT